MDTLITAVVAVFASVLGSVVGGLFTMWAVTRSHKLERAAQTEHESEITKRVRTMLSLEIDDNYAALERFDAGINEAILFQNSSPQPKERAQQLSDVVLPFWKHEYWEGLTDSIPLALSPDEIRACHEFHSSLKELTRLKGLSRSPQGAWQDAMEQAINRLKGIKNPLLAEPSSAGVRKVARLS